MDLGAYQQIENLEKIAKDNGIEIPRLRGYRLMKNEEPISQTEIDEMKKDCEIEVVRTLIRAKPYWSISPNFWCSDEYTDMLEDYYLIKNPENDGYQRYIGIRWDRIHGWKRKILKFAIKKQKKEIQKQYDIWNKYAGKENVLYIHSRMGGGNWEYYNFEEKVELLNQPWFLDRVDDCYDNTYCDFYAKINISAAKKE